MFEFKEIELTPEELTWAKRGGYILIALCSIAIGLAISLPFLQ